MTASRQLAFLTHKAHMCLASAESCQWSPSMIAVSLISLELEQFRSDWFPLTLSLLHFIQVSRSHLWSVICSTACCRDL
ncbi:CCNI2 [Bugula neritina]|uniref:CCNI2 n=1 Tax=Bugula neritina TaxID=10212 RepID=A0A7J7JLB9_BUGNE|nr:CCNI2 [Bugula neritina]